MGQPSRIRHKRRKQKEATARVNYDNAKPSQIAALDAERDKLLQAALKRLPASHKKLLQDKGPR